MLFVDLVNWLMVERNRNMKPKIRFTYGDTDWLKVVFTDIAERISISEISGKRPAVEYEDIISEEGILNKNIYAKDCKKKGIAFDEGDILFGKLRPYLKNILLADFKGVAVGDFWVLRSKEIESYILYILVNSNNFMKVANISSGSKMPRSDWNLVSISRFYIPSSLIEQQQITTYFQSLNHFISTSTSCLTSLKQIKAASLQSMFPKEGETTPRIRFKGFEGEWKKVRLANIFNERHEISTITDALPQLSFTIADGVIYPGDRKSNKRDFLIKDKGNKKYLVTFVGDIIYNPANVIYGAIHRNSLCNGVVSPIYKIFCTEQDSLFIECVIRRPSFISQLAMRTEGTVTKLKTLKPESFLEMDVMIASSLDEQREIGKYFKTLDHQITLQTRRLEKLKQIKAACLDKMFV